MPRSSFAVRACGSPALPTQGLWRLCAKFHCRTLGSGRGATGVLGRCASRSCSPASLAFSLAAALWTRRSPCTLIAPPNAIRISRSSSADPFASLALQGERLSSAVLGSARSLGNDQAPAFRISAGRFARRQTRRVPRRAWPPRWLRWRSIVVSVLGLPLRLGLGDNLIASSRSLPRTALLWPLRLGLGDNLIASAWGRRLQAAVY